MAWVSLEKGENIVVDRSRLEQTVDCREVRTDPGGGRFTMTQTKNSSI